MERTRWTTTTGIVTATALAALVAGGGIDAVASGSTGAGDLEGGGATAIVQDADFRWTGRIAGGDRIEIKNVNGPVRAERSSDGRVEVVARKEPGDEGDPDEVTFDVLEHEGGVTICAVYPTPSGKEPNECRPGSRGRMNTRRNDTEVEFTVRIPAGVDFAGRSVNGDVTARALGGDVEARTVNGEIDVSTDGTVTGAETVNGSIDAAMGRADWSGTVHFSTVNGGIELTLPGTLAADVEISTVNGSIDTDFPLTVRGRWGPKRARGTVGGGGPLLDLETVNGSIRLRKSS